MFQVGKTIISEEILENEFVCNLSACKGACCVEGEAGAPLDKEETLVLEANYPAIKPFLRPEGITAIEAQGVYTIGEDGEWETPLVKGKECAYTVFSEKGIAMCGIEQAYNAQVITWKKPVSCHLYPIRVKKYNTFTAVNYNEWQICGNACKLGKELQVPVYKFVKEALIRKFGNEWYEAVTKHAEQIKNNIKKS